MKDKVEIRFPKTTDAKRLFEILSSTHPNFGYIATTVGSVEEEKEWIKATKGKRDNNIEWNYAITLSGYVVGSMGIKIAPNRPYVGEIGYFIDENYWGRGIATKAVALAEKEGFKKLKLARIEIIMAKENKGSEKVAIKNKYKREGLMRQSVKDKQGKLHDAWMYAKIK